ncbi:MAG: pyrroline-5-carboxylate reductase [Paracoccaceae bacterium]|jgi:pyrroline-5-carboxylate reductase
MRIGIIGTGTIASAVVRGIALDGHQITVSERNAIRAAQLAADYDSVTVAPNQTVLDQSDVIFLGTTTDVADTVLTALTFSPHHRVISLMAGPSLAQIAAMVAPAQAEALMIPFPAIASGNSPILVCPASPLLQQIFSARNTVIPLADSADMHSYLAAQAVLSPSIKLLADTAKWLGQRINDPTQAEAFLRQLIGGSLLAAPLEAPGVLDQMIADLNTPGGLNAQLRDFLQESGTFQALQDGLDQLEVRTKGDTA